MPDEFLTLFGARFTEEAETAPTASPSAGPVIASVEVVLDGQCVVRLPDGRQVLVQQTVFERVEWGSLVAVFADGEGGWSLIDPNWGLAPHPGEPPALDRGTNVSFEVLGYDAALDALVGHVDQREAFAPRSRLPWPASYLGADLQRLVGQTLPLTVVDPLSPRVELAASPTIKRLPTSMPLARLYALKTLSRLKPDLRVRVIVNDDITLVELFGKQYQVFPEDRRWTDAAQQSSGHLTDVHLSVDMCTADIVLTLRCPHHPEWSEIRRRYPVGSRIERAHFLSLTYKGLIVAVPDPELNVIGILPVQQLAPPGSWRFGEVPLPLRVAGYSDERCTLVLDIEPYVDARWKAAAPRSGQILALNEWRWSTLEPLVLWDLGSRATITRPLVGKYEWGVVMESDPTERRVVIEPQGPLRPGRINPDCGEKTILFDDGASANLTRGSVVPRTDDGALMTSLQSMSFGLRGSEVAVGLVNLRRTRVIHELQRRQKSSTPVRGRVRARVKGGLEIELLDVLPPAAADEAEQEASLVGFLPQSQIDWPMQQNFQDSLGEIYEFAILDVKPGGRGVVLSLRARREALRAMGWQKMAHSVKVGDTISGVVRNVVDYGVFLDLGDGIDGLLHITEIPYDGVPLTARFTHGQRVDTFLLSANPTTERVSLSMLKPTTSNWSEAHERFPFNSRVTGEVETIVANGLVVSLGDGFRGFVSRAQLAWGAQQPQGDWQLRLNGRTWSQGDRLSALVLAHDDERGRVILDARRCLPNPWQVFASLYPPGSHLAGRIQAIKSLGILVSLAPGVLGSLPGSMRAPFAEREAVRVRVVAIDVGRQRVTLALDRRLFPPADEREVVAGAVLDGHVEDEDHDHLRIHFDGLDLRGRLARDSVAAFFGKHEQLEKGTRVVVEVLNVDIEQATRVPTLALRDIESDTTRRPSARKAPAQIIPPRESALPVQASATIKDPLRMSDGQIVSLHVLSARHKIRKAELDTLFRGLFGREPPFWSEALELEKARALVTALTSDRQPAQAIEAPAAPARSVAPSALPLTAVRAPAPVAAVPREAPLLPAAPTLTTAPFAPPLTVAHSTAPEAAVPREAPQPPTNGRTEVNEVNGRHATPSSFPGLRRYLLAHGAARTDTDEDNERLGESQTDSYEPPKLAIPAEELPAQLEPSAGALAPPSRSAQAAPREVVLASWLHVSDIHFGQGSTSYQYDQKLVVAELCHDVQELVSEKRAPWPEYVFVTGDIAFTGGGRPPTIGQQEYELAEAWFNDLLGVLKLGRERVYLIPGNHDVDRGTDKDPDISMVVNLARINAQKHQLDDALTNAQLCERLSRRMERFLKFASAFGPEDRKQFQGGLWWRHERALAEGVTLRVCGLNTALLSASDEDKGRLRLGNRQLAELLLPPPGPQEVVIVLSHHPFVGGWLADEAEARGRLDRYSALHLFGHIHEADSEQTRGGGWSHHGLRIAAGATHAEEKPPAGMLPVGHGYGFGALVLLPSGELVVRVWPRRWASNPSRFVVHAEKIDERKGYAEHPLPHRISRPPTPTGLAPGVLLGGRYLLEAQLGKGGIGRVFRAVDTHADGRRVALKVLNDDGLPPPPERRTSFFRGPVRMLRINHPAIVKILDPRPDPDNQSSRYDFYVMDFVDGNNLSDAFHGRPCSDGRAIELLLAIGEGLAAAHRESLIHRDLKPSNVILDRKGQVRIVDFDTVKDLSNPTATRSSAHLVSQLYAAPEVLGRGVFDVRADIYSLAVTGIYLLLGEDPSMDFINRMSERAATLKCSDGLRRVLMHACSYEARNRYENIGAMLDALRVLHGRGAHHRSR